MMKKILGYILAILGILGLASAVVKPLRGALTFIPSQLSNTFLLIAGLILVVIGILLAFSRGGKKQAEVPIYQGRQIIGYRRV